MKTDDDRWYVVYSVKDFPGRHIAGPYKRGRDLEMQVQEISGYVDVYDVRWYPEGMQDEEHLR